MNNKYWAIIGILIILSMVPILVYIYYLQTIHPPPSIFRHTLKVKEIYQTKLGGREWFIDMNNPTGDGIFDPGSPIKQQADGSWEINGNLRPGNKYEDQVRMTVGTPAGQEQ